MFRAVSDQIYGNEEYHYIIREKMHEIFIN